MNVQIISDKKLNWSYVNKVAIRITSPTLHYEEPLSLSDIHKLHFATGALLQEYYAEGKK